ncbi:hypothetical protein FVO59_09485 [Microbacterium esteraromaticum]|uniref:Uncharacterized protein n=1 Tax=Microbacterium esteraromaticum TaxID=57043 RepID=A0A7D8AGU1_9MICO|nr:hypothetical protein [Microbacterium esteraromaticum]QMU97422.1 hypothetical protein FVO59_09485 [Microbacterium esteraromaticum]
MTTLDDLFPEGGRRCQDAPADRSQADRLGSLLGDRRPAQPDPSTASSRDALIALVRSTPTGQQPQAPRAATRTAPYGGRPRRSRDAVSVAAASLAALAVAAASLTWGVQAATADPASDALTILADDERTIEGVELGLATARSRLAAELEESLVGVDEIRAALEVTREATDPADIPPGSAEPGDGAGVIPIADAAALDAALSAVDAHRSALAATELPSLPTQYRRAQGGADDLESVGQALDAAQKRLSDLDRAAVELREVREGLQTSRAVLGDALDRFRATFPAAAERAVRDHPEAGQDEQDAVIAAAEAVAEADLGTGAGRSTLGAFRDAVIALAEDHVHARRLEEERERELQREQERRRSQPEPDSGPTTPSDDPPTEPSPSPSPSPEE